MTWLLTLASNTFLFPGKPNKKFWQNLYKISGGSGGPYITGWILNFFPYLEQSGRVFLNRFMDDWRKQIEGKVFCFRGATADLFSSGLSSAPFVWAYHDTKFKMRFVSGFIGVQQDPDTLALSPQIGWAIVDENNVN